MKKFLALLLAAIMLLPITACGTEGENGKGRNTFDWSSLELGDKLPEPSSNVGHVWEDDDKKLNVEVEKITKADYKDYVFACKELGFTIDSEKSDSRYEAYNSDNDHLKVYISDNCMSIELEVAKGVTNTFEV